MDPFAHDDFAAYFETGEVPELYEEEEAEGFVSFQDKEESDAAEDGAQETSSAEKSTEESSDDDDDKCDDSEGREGHTRGPRRWFSR